MKILISGASGFVGKQVLKLLLEKGHEVYGLTRSPEKNQKLFPTVNWIKWEGVRDLPDLSKISNIDAVINLVGENIAAKRWNNGQKKEIFNSRIDGTKSILKMLEAANLKPRVFVSTSATGIYGANENSTEDSNTADDFLANLCKAWEAAVGEGKDQGLYQRSVIIRVGLVLGRDGGLIQRLAPIFKRGLGGKLGKGKFYMSWIHVRDLARIYVRALEDENMSGVYNAVSPFPVTNEEFTRVLGQAVRKPTPFTVPKFALKLAMGEVAEYITKGGKVYPGKLKKDNFHFLYPTIEVAAKDVVSKS